MDPKKSCQICAKKSNGMHFGAMTCRACAAFFRRAVVLKMEYYCREGKNVCGLEGKGRSMCRYCRLEKCKEIGMDPEKVVLDYDPTVSQRVDSLKTGAENEKEEEKDPDMNFKFAPKQQDQLNMKIDFTELVEKITENFEVKDEKPVKNELESLTNALEFFRSDLLDKKDLNFIGKAKLEIVVPWLNARIRKYSIWFSHAKYLMETLPMDQKLQLFRTSWNIFRTFERIALTLKVYGQEALDRNLILISGNAVMIIDRTYVGFEEITELTDGYFNHLFHPFLNKYMEEVGKPMFELELTTEEVVFCMINLLGADSTGLTPETIEQVQKFKEIIADQMHHYYTNHTNHKMYSHRIMKMMNLVKSTKKIAREKAKVKELIWIFDVYHADISDQYFFQMF